MEATQSTAVEKFKSFAESLAHFPLKEWAWLAASLSFKRISKGEHLFRVGERSNVVGYVVSGLFQTYYLNHEGQENTKLFVYEGGLIGNWAYQMQGLPAGFSARALEDSFIVWIPFERLEQLQEKSHAVERMRRKASERILIERENRERELLTLSAYQRYEAFQKDFTPILRRIPQYLIASYLGISAEALTRLIKQNKKESL